MQEIQPKNGAGGFGWCQWTGTRRKAFFDMCTDQGLAATSDLANYSYLKKELTGCYSPSVAALKPRPGYAVAAGARRAFLQKDDVR